MDKAVDFDELLHEEANRPAAPLRVDVVLGLLPENQRGKVDRALRNKTVKVPHLSRALGKLGHSVSHCAIQNWRAKNGVE